jgi:hypothetical protein
VLDELKDVRQIPGEGMRRWFRDQDMDLIIWYDEAGVLDGFQLCYDKRRQERALTWRTTGSCTHQGVDAGESPYGARQSPVLVDGGVYDGRALGQLFAEHSALLPPELRDLVSAQIARGPQV